MRDLAGKPYIGEKECTVCGTLVSSYDYGEEGIKLNGNHLCIRGVSVELKSTNEPNRA